MINALVKHLIQFNLVVPTLRTFVISRLHGIFFASCTASVSGASIAIQPWYLLNCCHCSSSTPYIQITTYLSVQCHIQTVPDILFSHKTVTYNNKSKVISTPNP